MKILLPMKAEAQRTNEVPVPAPVYLPTCHESKLVIKYSNLNVLAKIARKTYFQVHNFDFAPEDLIKLSQIICNPAKLH